MAAKTATAKDQAGKTADCIKEIFYDVVITDLLSILEFKHSIYEAFNIEAENRPTAEAWSGICAAYNLEMTMLEKLVDILQTCEGNAPPYLKNAFSLMNEK